MHPKPGVGLHGKQKGQNGPKVEQLYRLEGAVDEQNRKKGWEKKN